MTLLFVGSGGDDRDDVDGQLAELPDPPGAVEPEMADVDLRIERPDLGPRAYTFIAAGHEIPRGLVDLPRHPVRQAPETPEARQPASSRRSRRT